MDPRTDAERQERFAALRRDLTAAGMETAQQHIDDIVGDFAQFIAPLTRIGFVDLEEIRNERLGSEQKVRVVSKSDSSLPRKSCSLRCAFRNSSMMRVNSARPGFRIRVSSPRFSPLCAIG